MWKKVLLAVGSVLMAATTASAQLGLNYTTFSPGQTISAAQFTENFTNISNKSLNRTGGTATGTITFDSGAEFNGSFTIGSGDVQPFDSTGKIQAISSTYFASLSGANLTGLLEANITDGSLLARVGATETISGAWTFSTAPTLAGTNITGIAETAITDGSLLARVGSTESITGSWSFTQTLNLVGLRTLDGHIALEHSTQTDWGLINDAGSLKTYTGLLGSGTYRHTFGTDGSFTATGAIIGSSASPIVSLIESGVAANSGNWRLVADGSVFAVQAMNDAQSSSSDVFAAGRTGATATSVSIGNASATTTIVGPAVLNGAVTTNSSLAVGTNLSVSGAASVTGTTTLGTANITTANITTLNTSGTLNSASVALTSDLSITTASGVGTYTASNISLNSAALGLATEGKSMFIGRNSSGSGAAGCLQLPNRSGTSYSFYVGTSNLLRVNTGNACPTESDSVTHAGSVVGDQTSNLAAKTVTRKRESQELLETVLRTSVYDFVYKDGRYNNETFTGIITDYAPWFGKDNNKSLNEINGLGYLIGAVQGLDKEIHQLDAQNRMLQAEIEFLVKRIKALEASTGGRRAE